VQKRVDLLSVANQAIYYYVSWALVMMYINWGLGLAAEIFHAKVQDRCIVCVYDYWLWQRLFYISCMR
jgi:short subunit fatty acids transporter